MKRALTAESLSPLSNHALPVVVVTSLQAGSARAATFGNKKTAINRAAQHFYCVHGNSSRLERRELLGIGLSFLASYSCGWTPAILSPTAARELQKLSTAAKLEVPPLGRGIPVGDRLKAGLRATLQFSLAPRWPRARHLLMRIAPRAKD